MEKEIQHLEGRPLKVFEAYCFKYAFVLIVIYFIIIIFFTYFASPPMLLLSRLCFSSRIYPWQTGGTSKMKWV